MPRLITLAGLCGAVPLLTGTAIYATWRLTRWSWLEPAGILTIFVGVLLVLTGAFLLILHMLRIRSHDSKASAQQWISILLIGSLLTVNFPAAVMFTFSAIDIQTRYIVTVTNESEHQIERFEVIGPGVHVDLGPIPVGNRVQRDLHIQGEGPLQFMMHHAGTTHSGDLDGYVTGNLGAETTILVRARRGDSKAQAPRIIVRR